MRTRLTWVVCAGLLLAADKAADPVRAEKEKLQGNWALAEAPPGSPATKGPKGGRGPGSEGWRRIRLTFAGDRVTLRDGEKPWLVKEPYRLDPAKTPKELDIGRGASRREWIYKLEGDKLVVAFPFPELVSGGTFAERQRHTRRPRDFKATKETPDPIVLVFKRVKR